MLAERVQEWTRVDGGPSLAPDFLGQAAADYNGTEVADLQEVDTMLVARRNTESRNVRAYYL
jgi:hypothetical protein